MTAKIINFDAERVVSILKRQQSEQATTATLVEIRRLKRELEARRANIDRIVAGWDDDIEWLRPCDGEGPP